ncbi:MAG: threonine synthase [Sutterellaceae bacterium]|uniref:threonine synthase n=2 Tax=Limnobacter TaxID=131079 RepID=UPI000C42F36F|nr:MULTISPECIES: threonine synthase [unclassified Limnobacter]MAG80128.1 threonine synthase [Sutterellaceae bacterium]MBT85428.1 threonine synthase [Sutterellaceae bacterium]HAV75645.1 threonine synthase [Limnobacter sp.]|tara:strand:+ start:313700 stop:315115 length:1416 start_codon:yes stop_codon:yes gene_type:complete
MKYFSSRGGMDPQDFSEILLEGLAPDGGLAVPEFYPQVALHVLESWKHLSYGELAFEVLKPYATDIPEADLKALTTKTYTKAVYGTEEITPVRELFDGMKVLELSNGPTLAFKDMAMQLLGNLFEYQLARTNRELNILGATSGDTGSAAEYAMRGKKGVRVFMLSPAGKMSAFQRAQMYSLQDPNIFNIAIEGLFDDCQDIVKAVSEDLEYKARQKIGTVNSINWGRISAQVVYYFNAYLRTAEKIGDPVSFAVPSGNFGNVLAGHIARQMGLPIRKLIVATNENNVLDEFFKTGVYRPRKSAETYITSSPSMDISKASNFERFVYDLLGRDPKALKALWQDLAANGQFDLSEDPRFKRVEEDFGFQSGSSNHQNRLDTIKEVFARTGTLIDTHTADAVKVARDLVEPGVPMVILETALAVKFAETIEEATGQTPPVPAQFLGIEKLPQRVVEMPISVEQVKTFIAENTGL